MKKVLLTIVDGTKNNAAPKAKEDIINFLGPKGFENWKITMNFHSKIQKIWEANFHLPALLKRGSFDEMVFQFPAYSFYLMKRFVRSFRKYHQNSKLIFIVHDVESLRQNANGQYDQDEVMVLNAADGLIVHNNKMKQYLSSIGVNTPMVCLHIFDYDNPQPLIKLEQLDHSVCFAGNLAKSSFLTKVKGDFKLNVYGPNPADKYQHPVSYEGVYSPEELPKHLKGDFGLVWDGTSVSKCDGVYGNYLKYNAPHKVSLYISSGLPVIVWKQAAIAQYVVEHKLGYAIDNLNDIPQLLKTISEADYHQMKDNAEACASSMREGYNIKLALQNMEAVLSSN